MDASEKMVDTEDSADFEEEASYCLAFANLEGSFRGVLSLHFLMPDHRGRLKVAE